jgi:hypothetical protein
LSTTVLPRSEVEFPLAVQALERERRRGRRAAALELRRDLALVLRQLPGEQGEQRRHDPDGRDLAGQPKATGHRTM